ncbi:hypothetical protein Taro_003358 [Colocasia esculenta]|uniref:Uncharacterized protein n=1 Tax=Colocasia esculenta TaxID=4460 RepID=A0A843TFB9_COLES|nr:hypothetical protein [Colocasia esculenta]
MSWHEDDDNLLEPNKDGRGAYVNPEHADMDIFRGNLAWAIIQEVNEKKAQEMVCEQDEEKYV